MASFTLVLSLIVALFVFMKNPRSATNSYFGILVFFMSIYPLFNYLAVTSSSNEVAFSWAKLILFVSIPQGPLLFFFAKVYPKKDFIFNKKVQSVIIIWVLLNIILASSGLIFNGVTISGGSVSITPGPLVPSFALLHIGTIISGLFILFRKRAKSLGQQRLQLSFVAYGISFSFALTFLITIVLPILFKNTLLLSISPLFLSIGVISVGYAIVSHKLFDIRAALVRSVAYILLGSTLIGIYVFIVFFVATKIFSSDSLLAKQLVPLGAALFLVMTAPYFKILFDRFTNRIFYRDAYDPQEFLDELNSSIVSNIEIGILLRHSTSVIQKNLKSEYCAIIIPSEDGHTFRAVGFDDGKLRLTELKVLNDRVKKSNKKIVTYEELDDYGAELKIIFDKYNIAILSHLTTLSYGQRQTIAYVLLGPKKSGNIYSSQDVKIIDLISDELVIAIQNALRFEEIQEFNVTLQQKVNEATSKLKRTNEKLKSMDETKDEFISMASHQLRTPLTSVKGYLSMVLEGDAGDVNDNQRKLLDQAFVSSQRMVYLISDLLNVSRLRTGKFIIDAHPANLAEIVEGEIAQLKEQANSRNQELVFDKPDDFPSLMLDETKTRQVIMNFVDNAMFYTPSGGKIKVELSTDKNHVYFMVKDNGIGVPKEEQKHMFTKFYRAKNARNARPDGTGLGLFMAKKVIVAQGGNVLFDSTEGKGSTFGFSFNKKHLALPEDT